MARRFPLRPTILVWFSGLLTCTIAVIGAVAFFETVEVLDVLTAQHLRSVAHSTRAEVRHLLTPAPRILTEIQLLAQDGDLPEDPHARGMFFVERMRQNPEVGWLGYARDADHTFTGGTRSPEGGLRWYRSDPAVNGGVATEYRVDVRGEFQAVEPSSPDPYDPTTRPWYQEAKASPALRWLEPYEFTDGRWGMSLTRGVVRHGEVEGVLLADYFLEDITAFLDTVEVGETGRVEIVTAEGLILGDSEAHVAELLLAMPREGVHEIDVLGEPHRVVWEAIEVEGGLRWDLAVMVPEAELSGLAHANAWRTAQVGALALLLALVGAAWFASTVSRPIRDMSAIMERIARLDIPDERPPASPIAEIHTMANAMGAMEAGLASFARYVPVDLVRTLLASGVAARLGAEPRRLTVLFTDIAGFTPLLESTPPERVVEALAEYLRAMDLAIGSTGGVVSQYLGDGVLAYWGAPADDPDHELNACLGVLEMRRASRRLEEESGLYEMPLLHTRFGLNTGDVLVGNIGAPNRFNYTALGDAVNTASRIEGLNKVYGTEVLLGEATAARVRGKVVLREIDRVAVKGKQRSLTIFELVAAIDDVPPSTLTWIEDYERALRAYQARRFDEALAGFSALWDPASEVMAGRCREYLADPPPDDWDGTQRMKTK